METYRSLKRNTFVHLRYFEKGTLNSFKKTLAANAMLTIN